MQIGWLSCKISHFDFGGFCCDFKSLFGGVWVFVFGGSVYPLHKPTPTAQRDRATDFVWGFTKWFGQTCHRPTARQSHARLFGATCYPCVYLYHAVSGHHSGGFLGHHRGDRRQYDIGAVVHRQKLSMGQKLAKKSP